MITDYPPPSIASSHKTIKYGSSSCQRFADVYEPIVKGLIAA